jgi:hypothetical protein
VFACAIEHSGHACALDSLWLTSRLATDELNGDKRSQPDKIVAHSRLGASRDDVLWPTKLEATEERGRCGVQRTFVVAGSATCLNTQIRQNNKVFTTATSTIVSMYKSIVS